MEKRGGERAVPFVTALLAVPLVSHPRRDVCPGYPSDIASLLGHHRSYYRGQFLDFFARPRAYVVWCKLIRLLSCTLITWRSSVSLPLRRSLRCAR